MSGKINSSALQTPASVVELRRRVNQAAADKKSGAHAGDSQEGVKVHDLINSRGAYLQQLSSSAAETGGPGLPGIPGSKFSAGGGSVAGHADVEELRSEITRLSGIWELGNDRTAKIGSGLTHLSEFVVNSRKEDRLHFDERMSQLTERMEQLAEFMVVGFDTMSKRLLVQSEQLTRLEASLAERKPGVAGKKTRT